MTIIQSQIPDKFTGIIQLSVIEGMPSYSTLVNIQDNVVAVDNRWIPVAKLHCTLLHQSFPKKVQSKNGVRGDKALKALYKSADKPAGEINLNLGNLFHCQDLSTGRESIGIWVEGPEPEQIRSEILQSAGISLEDIFETFTSEEASRRYHISLANLDGNSGSSPAYPSDQNTSPFNFKR